MTFSEAVPTVFRKYVDFNGRADRSEYWWFALFTFIVSAVLSTLQMLSGLSLFSFLSGIFGLGTILPSLAVAARRMHDIGKSGWWILICLIPVLGWIWYIVLAATPSQQGPNQYGLQPVDTL